MTTTAIERYRVTLAKVAEAIDVGDVDLARELVDAALAGAGHERPADPFSRRRCCRLCGVGPMWPGQLDDHLRHVHTRAA